jgi:hypothetical protein
MLTTRVVSVDFVTWTTQILPMVQSHLVATFKPLMFGIATPRAMERTLKPSISPVAPAKQYRHAAIGEATFAAIVVVTSREGVMRRNVGMDAVFPNGSQIILGLNMVKKNLFMDVTDMIPAMLGCLMIIGQDLIIVMIASGTIWVMHAIAFLGTRICIA